MTIQHGPEVQRVLDLIESDKRYAVDLTLLDELKDVVRETRRYKDLTASQFKTREDLHELGKRLDESQWLRSRVKTIKFGYMWMASSLDRLWDACCAFLYRDDEYRKMTPAPARDAKISAALSLLCERRDNCKLIIKMADDADSYLSNAYFAMRELIRVNTAYLGTEKDD